MKRLKKLKVFIAVLACSLSLGLVSETSAVLGGTYIVQAAKKETKYQKILRLYKNKQYTQVRKICKKLPKKANEKCLKRMPKKMKQVYLDKVRSYQYTSYGKNLEQYFLTDINNDGKPELLIEEGSGEVQYRLIVYTYKNGNLKRIGSTSGWHSRYYAYPNRNGLVIMRGQNAVEELRLLTMNDSRLKVKIIGKREPKDFTEYQSFKYIRFPYELDGHSRYSSRYSNSFIDYGDLM